MVSIKPGQVLAFEYSLVTEISNNNSSIYQEVNRFLHDFTYSCQDCGDTVGLYLQSKVLHENERDDMFKLVTHCATCEKKHYKGQLQKVKLALAAELVAYLDSNRIRHESQFAFSHPYFQESTDYMLAAESELLPDIIPSKSVFNCATCGKLDSLEYNTYFEQWGTKNVLVLKFTCKNCITNLVESALTEQSDGKLSPYLLGRVHGAISASLRLSLQ